MKPILFFMLVAITPPFSFADTAKAPTKMPPIVGAEYEKTHELFIKNFKEYEKALDSLRQEKKQIVQEYKAKAPFYEEGLEALNKYDLLLVVRNTDSKGEYEPRNQVSTEDVNNLNAIFQRYLNSTLLPERVSARYARKVIGRAMNELDRLHDAYSEPDESNNPELEIVEKQIEDATRKNELVLDFAKRIGIDVKREVAAEKAE